MQFHTFVTKLLHEFMSPQYKYVAAGVARFVAPVRGAPTPAVLQTVRAASGDHLPEVRDRLRGTSALPAIVYRRAARSASQVSFFPLVVQILCCPPRDCVRRSAGAMGDVRGRSPPSLPCSIDFRIETVERVEQPGRHR
ncbi:MAG: hypothetical protein IPK83_14270 [Planctomycetes bacterium]|nr:hypothetical protein [Planctomycetota bacterium]